MEFKEIKWRIVIGTILLIVSFILIVIFSYQYLAKYTNFYEQTKSLIEGKNQLMNQGFINLLKVGIIFFGFSTLFLWKDIRWYYLLFLVDSLLIISSVLLALSFILNFKFNFRLALILSAFIIYYVVHKAKNELENYRTKDELKRRYTK